MIIKDQANNAYADIEIVDVLTEDHITFITRKDGVEVTLTDDEIERIIASYLD